MGLDGISWYNFGVSEAVTFYDFYMVEEFSNKPFDILGKGVLVVDKGPGNAGGANENLDNEKNKEKILAEFLRIFPEDEFKDAILELLPKRKNDRGSVAEKIYDVMKNGVFFDDSLVGQDQEEMGNKIKAFFSDASNVEGVLEDQKINEDEKEKIAKLIKHYAEKENITVTVLDGEPETKEAVEPSIEAPVEASIEPSAPEEEPAVPISPKPEAVPEEKKQEAQPQSWEEQYENAAKQIDAISKDEFEKRYGKFPDRSYVDFDVKAELLDFDEHAPGDSFAREHSKIWRDTINIVRKLNDSGYSKTLVVVDGSTYIVDKKERTKKEDKEESKAKDTFSDKNIAQLKEDAGKIMAKEIEDVKDKKKFEALKTKEVYPADIRAHALQFARSKTIGRINAKNDAEAVKEFATFAALVKRINESESGQFMVYDEKTYEIVEQKPKEKTPEEMLSEIDEYLRNVMTEKYRKILAVLYVQIEEGGHEADVEREKIEKVVIESITRMLEKHAPGTNRKLVAEYFFTSKIR